MPYNTRRKSLSLPSLGIHVPMSNAARAAAAAAAAAALANRHSPSASSTAAGSNSAMSTTSSSAAASAASPSSSIFTSASSVSSSPIFSPRSPASDSLPRKPADAQTSARKTKRPHASAHAAADGADHAARAPKRRQTDANTPPPSPRHRARSDSFTMYEDLDDDAYAHEVGVDLARIDDEIVRAVIVQLQATRNRPHIVKDLAAVLMKDVKIVQASANPSAIISSRLSGFLKRSGWNARNPCPLAKELETVHPRRTYFYLAAVPHQPLPDPMLSATKPREIPTPSATSICEAEEDERRRELSPSPEVDLSGSEGDDADDDVPMPGTPIGSTPSYPSRYLDPLQSYSQLTRYALPPLEKDEKEFTRTADNLQRRKLSGELDLVTRSEPVAAPTLDAADEHSKYDILFGENAAAAGAAATLTHSPAMNSLSALIGSPAIRPLNPVDMKKEKESEATWASSEGYLDIRDPETVSLAELNEMLGDY